MGLRKIFPTDFHHKSCLVNYYISLNCKYKVQTSLQSPHSIKSFDFVEKKEDMFLLNHIIQIVPSLQNGLRVDYGICNKILFLFECFGYFCSKKVKQPLWSGKRPWRKIEGPSLLMDGPNPEIAGAFIDLPFLIT